MVGEVFVNEIAFSGYCCGIASCVVFLLIRAAIDSFCELVRKYFGKRKAAKNKGGEK